MDKITNKLMLVSMLATFPVSAWPSDDRFRLYGELHASLDALEGGKAIDTNNDGMTDSVVDHDSTSVSSNASHVGVKGAQKLNGDMLAIYKAEWGINTGGNDTDVFYNRNQVVGLAGKWGSLVLGRHDTPFKIVGRKLDLGHEAQLGSSYNMTARGKGQDWDLRADNTVIYQTPKKKGFQALAAVVTEHDGNDETAISTHAIYQPGALGLYAAWEKRNATDENGLRLGASWESNRSKWVTLYQRTADEAGVKDSDREVFGIGASRKVFTSGTVKGQFYSAKGDAAGDNADMLTLGYDHNLGEKTNVYIQYSQIEGEPGNNLYQLGTFERTDGVSGDAFGDAQGVSLGVSHKF